MKLGWPALRRVKRRRTARQTAAARSARPTFQGSGLAVEARVGARPSGGGFAGVDGVRGSGVGVATRPMEGVETLGAERGWVGPAGMGAVTVGASLGCGWEVTEAGGGRARVAGVVWGRTSGASGAGGGGGGGGAPARRCRGGAGGGGVGGSFVLRYGGGRKVRGRRLRGGGRSSGLVRGRGIEHLGGGGDEGSRGSDGGVAGCSGCFFGEGRWGRRRGGRGGGRCGRGVEKQVRLGGEDGVRFGLGEEGDIDASAAGADRPGDPLAALGQEGHGDNPLGLLHFLEVLGEQAVDAFIEGGAGDGLGAVGDDDGGEEAGLDGGKAEPEHEVLELGFAPEGLLVEKIVGGVGEVTAEAGNPDLRGDRVGLDGLAERPEADHVASLNQVTEATEEEVDDGLAEVLDPRLHLGGEVDGNDVAIRRGRGRGGWGAKEGSGAQDPCDQEEQASRTLSGGPEARQRRHDSV